MTCMMGHEKHLWNVIVLLRVRLSSIIIIHVCVVLEIHYHTQTSLPLQEFGFNVEK
jgi:hypothetical protein